MDADAGKKPKSVALIRDRLARVHELADRPADKGPFAAGLQATDRLPIATFLDPQCAAAYQQKLLDGGVYSTTNPYRERTAVLVDLEDRAPATRILEAHLKAFPDRRRRRTRGFEATMFLTLAATLTSLFIALAAGNSSRGGIIPWHVVGQAMGMIVIVSVHAACAGSFIDLVRTRQFDFESGRYNLLFILWLTTAAALAAFWYF